MIALYVLINVTEYFSPLFGTKSFRASVIHVNFQPATYQRLDRYYYGWKRQ